MILTRQDPADISSRKYVRKGRAELLDRKTKGTTKSLGRKHQFDKFYTKPTVAKQLLSTLDLTSYHTIVEPSAGSGAFSLQIPNCIAIDLHPEHPTISQQDFFTYQATRNSQQKTLVVGNPPFGQQNNLAISFINHAATFADTVAFVLPVSFHKESIQARLDKHLHLVSSTLLSSNSFTLMGEDVDVPSAFFIWEWKSNLRTVTPTPTPIGFKWVKKTENPDLFIQRIGGKAGTSGIDWQGRSTESNYFIQATTATTQQVLQDLQRLPFKTRDYGVGPRSISKKEILRELAEINSPLVKE